MSWVRRRASVDRICDSCDDLIAKDRTYFKMVTGEIYCIDCPPEEGECSL